MKTLFLSSGILLLLVLLSGCEKKKSMTGLECTFKKLNFDVDLNETQYLVLKNKTTVDVRFAFSINRMFFRTIDDVEKYIKNQFKSRYTEDYLKAWDFVYKYTIHDYPVSYDSWYHNPMMFLNSPGFGFCDDRAWMLCNIWKTQGYKARVVSVEGHVVPEIWIDNAYRMYDPDYGMYYYNSKGECASVEELSENPWLIFNPARMHDYDKTFRSCINGFSVRMSQNYFSTSDNTILGEEEYDVYNPFIKIPPGAEMVLPLKKAKSFNLYGLINNSGYIKIPAGFKGEIFLPFMIKKIKGEVNLTYDKEKFMSDSILRIDYSRHEFVNAWHVDCISDVYVYFYINPRYLMLNSTQVEVRIAKVGLLGPSVEISDQHADAFRPMMFYFPYEISDDDCNCLRILGNSFYKVIQSKQYKSMYWIFNYINQEFACDTSYFNFTEEDAQKAIYNFITSNDDLNLKMLEKGIKENPLFFYCAMRADTNVLRRAFVKVDD